jgi:formylglycine-generating enzyme required for sulfatase activity
MRSTLYLCSSLFLLRASAQTPEMAVVPEGNFWMGRTHFFLVDAVGWFERDRQDDFPAHRVFLDAFSIDKHEVTNESYARFLSSKGGAKPWHWPHGSIPKGEEKFPVYNVDWKEAAAYCGWAGERLPTEAEWEKAARGGLDRKKFTWGDGEEPSGARGTARAKLPANFGSTGAVEVGKYPPNGYGLFDMAGNVWEWTNDWYERNYYSISPLKNPKGPEKGAYKVFRGGGWNDADERNLMPSFRNYTDPLEKSITIGFRCAK